MGGASAVSGGGSAGGSAGGGAAAGAGGAASGGGAGKSGGGGSGGLVGGGAGHAGSGSAGSAGSAGPGLVQTGGAGAGSSAGGASAAGGTMPGGQIGGALAYLHDGPAAGSGSGFRDSIGRDANAPAASAPAQSQPTAAEQQQQSHAAVRGMIDVIHSYLGDGEEDNDGAASQANGKQQSAAGSQTAGAGASQPAASQPTAAIPGGGQSALKRPGPPGPPPPPPPPAPDGSQKSVGHGPPPPPPKPDGPQKPSSDPKTGGDSCRVGPGGNSQIGMASRNPDDSERFTPGSNKYSSTAMYEQTGSAKNKKAVSDALDSVGASKQDKALILAMGMQEDHGFDKHDKNKDYDGDKQNFSAFNLNKYQLGKLGYKGDMNALNDNSSHVGEVAKLIYQKMYDPSVGLDRLMSMTRGGESGDNGSWSKDDLEKWKNGQQDAANHILDAGPSAFTDDRRWVNEAPYKS